MVEIIKSKSESPCMCRICNRFIANDEEMLITHSHPLQRDVAFCIDCAVSIGKEAGVKI